jgi:DnaJ-class molecular chaperone
MTTINVPVTLPADLALFSLVCKRAPSRQELRQEYLRLAREAHPDIGGTAEKYGAVIKAYDRLKVYYNQGVQCPNCKGKGGIESTHGFVTLRDPCRICHRTGIIPWG